MKCTTCYFSSKAWLRRTLYLHSHPSSAGRDRPFSCASRQNNGSSDPIVSDYLSYRVENRRAYPSDQAHYRRPAVARRVPHARQINAQSRATPCEDSTAWLRSRTRRVDISSSRRRRTLLAAPSPSVAGAPGSKRRNRRQCVTKTQRQRDSR